MTHVLPRVARLADGTPPALAAAVALLVLNNVLGVVVTVGAAVADGDRAADVVLLALLTVAVSGVLLGRALLLRRRSRVAWSVLVLLLVATALAGPGSSAGVPMWALDVAALPLLLLPASLRWTWRRPAAHPAAPDLRRPD